MATHNRAIQPRRCFGRSIGIVRVDEGLRESRRTDYFPGAILKDRRHFIVSKQLTDQECLSEFSNRDSLGAFRIRRESNVFGDTPSRVVSF
jgi:hypothetical protein